MTLEEAKAIRACNGRGYSTVEFIKALQLTEPNPPKDCSREGKEKEDIPEYPLGCDNNGNLVWTVCSEKKEAPINLDDEMAEQKKL